MLQNKVIFCKFISPDCEMNPISQRVSLLRMTLLSLKIYSLEYWFIPFIFATSISVGALWLLFQKTRHGLGQEYFKLEILVSSPRIVFYTLLKCIEFWFYVESTKSGPFCCSIEPLKILYKCFYYVKSPSTGLGFLYLRSFYVIFT